MRTVSEANHIPASKRYCDTFVIDTVTGQLWVYDCAGTFFLMTDNGIAVAGKAYLVATFDGQNSFASGVNNFCSVSELSNAGFIENEAQTAFFPVNATALKVRVDANTCDDDTVVTLRLNGANSILAITIPAGATGIFDVTGPLAIAVDDLINYQVDTTASTLGDTIAITSVVLEYIAV